jgi:hypothetical protein
MQARIFVSVLAFCTLPTLAAAQVAPLEGLKSVQIRSYKFSDDFVYPTAEIDALRTQLSRPGWSQLVKARHREQNENVDIYVAMENRIVEAVAIIACEPRGFTIVNVAGTIDLDRISQLRQTFAPAGEP